MASEHQPSAATKLLDDLVVKQPGPGVRAISLVMRGVRNVTAQVPPYTEWWNDQNHATVERLLVPGDARPDRKLLVSLGDSSALGIGAKAPELSYIGQLTTLLNGQSQTAVDPSSSGWDVINLSMSGARASDGIDRQLPQLQRLVDGGIVPDLVICCLGSNDVFWGNGNRRQSSNQRNATLRADLTRLIGALPDSAVVGETAGRSERAQLANKTVRATCDARGLLHLNPWQGDDRADDGRKRLSEDRFHLNEVGYEDMAQNFLKVLVANGRAS